MNTGTRISAIAVAVSLGWASPALAGAKEDAAMRQEIAAMRAQMQALAARVDSLEGQLDSAKARAESAEARASAAIAQAEAAKAAIPAVTTTAKPATEVTWDGAPRLATKDGFSFKPRGRMQLDMAGVDAPAGIAGQSSLGIATEFRRVYLGADGTIPGGFGYRVEAELANGNVDLTDVYLSWKANPKLTITVGQHKPFQSMDDMTSDLFTSNLERASFNTAFGFERRIGLSATYTGKNLLVQGGVFTDNAADLSVDSNNSYSVDGRIVFMPKLGKGQLHLGGSVHLRDFNDGQTSTRYRARPFVHTTDLRLVNTGNIAATGENGYGLEAAYINGRFHATAESSWMTARRPGLADPTFNGGYAEVGYLLTDDTTVYKAGAYDRIRPKQALGKGGIGAIQLNLRYDWLDLNDGGIVGGRQQIGSLGLVWMPTDYVRLLASYGHIWLNDAALPAAGDRSYTADSLGLRAQFDF